MTGNVEGNDVPESQNCLEGSSEEICCVGTVLRFVLGLGSRLNAGAVVASVDKWMGIHQVG